MKTNWSRNAFVYLLILVAGAALFFNISWSNQAPEPISLSELAQKIQAGQVAKVTVSGEDIQVGFTKATNQADRIARREYDIPLTQTLTGLGVSPADLSSVNIHYEAPSNSSNWLALLINLLPLVFIGGLFFILFRQTQGSNNQALSFGKSRARLFTGDKPTITFDDIAGADEAKQELEEVVEFLKEPQKFAALGARIPKGVLLVGPPGTGKTLMAKAVSGEAGVPFFSISGSEFVEMFVGVGASRVRDLFEQAKRNSPCIIFIDEIDALGASRSDMKQSNSRHLINQFLQELDGIEGSNEGILVIGATNAPWNLDAAFRRPGRFDRIIFVSPPDETSRESIFKLKLNGKPISNIDFSALAKKTENYSGADIDALIDIAIEEKLEKSFADGIPTPIETKDLLNAIKKHHPSTMDWFQTAKNYALFANESGLYDEILKYLKIKK